MTDTISNSFRSGLLVLALTCSGCASFSGADLTGATESAASHSESSAVEPSRVAEFAPRGPGHVFLDVNAAAIDALAFCFLESRKMLPSERLARGGAIRTVDGGFTYDAPSVSKPGIASRLRYRLAPSDVAHFQHSPEPGPAGVVASVRSIERRTRRFVDRRDAMTRPLYTLSSQRVVRVYAGAEIGERTMAKVQHGTRRGATHVDLRTQAGPVLDIATERAQASIHPLPGVYPMR